MSGLHIGPAESLQRLQQLAMITPPEKVEESKKTKKTETEYRTQAEKQQDFYESFWEGMLTLFIKIPFIKNLTLFINLNTVVTGSACYKLTRFNFCNI